MTNVEPQIDRATSPPTKSDPSTEVKEDRILCPHCKRTANNGIKCKGICVAESDY
jgi:hypothetical protein